MVTSDSTPVTVAHFKARLIYICGCDGTGKSTQAHQLLAHLAKLGIPVSHLWLRFPFLFSLPLLAYARWRGYSWSEEREGVRYGYWSFRQSWLLRHLLPWVLLLDAAVAALVKLYWPLWLGRTVVCERFVLDILADLAVAFDDVDWPGRLPGRLYPALLPRRAIIVMLDLEADTIRARRPDLQFDRRLENRLSAFRQLAKQQNLTVISSEFPLETISAQILERIYDGNRT